MSVFQAILTEQVAVLAKSPLERLGGAVYELRPNQGLSVGRA